MNINFDQSELDKFSDLAHEWWSPNSQSFWALHAINPLRLSWINGIAPIKDKKILDVGCGGGILAESMADLMNTSASNGSVLGIDLSYESLQVARLHALELAKKSIHYRQISAEDLAKEAESSFDIVTCMEMLEHVPDPLSVIRACSKLVKPQGWVFFSTINRNLSSFIKNIVGAEYLLRFVPKATHQYGRFITPSELMRWARDSHLTPKAIQGLTYSLTTRRFMLSQNTLLNYFVAAQKEA